MAEDWATDVKKYVPDADQAAIGGIVRYCGIALQTRDASLVCFTDPEELARVRDNYCRAKLGLTQSDEEVDAAIARVGDRMKGDTTRNRVTVYYLLAETFGKLGLFGSATSSGAALRGKVAGADAVSGSAPTLSARAMPASASVRDRGRDDGSMADGGFALVGCGVLAVLVLGTATFGTIIGNWAGRGSPVTSSSVMAAEPAVAAAPAVPAAPAIPEGAGMLAKDVDGKPVVSVFFDTAKTDIAPDFATVAAPIKAWIDDHSGARAGVSGFNDPRGNAAFNAELSKNRAKAVAAALARIGVPAKVIDLDKPPETTDTDTSLTQARRVDIVVKDAPDTR